MPSCPYCNMETNNRAVRNRRFEPVCTCRSRQRYDRSIVQTVDISPESQAIINRLNRTTIVRRPAGHKKRSELTPHQETLIKQIFAVVIVSCLPGVSWPFDILETFFHELSHGLTALLLGGEIYRIDVGFHGGRIMSSGEGGMSRFLVSWSGYAGATVWGVLIYRTGLLGSAKQVFTLVLALVTLLAASTILWVYDPDTILCLLVTYSMLACSLMLLGKPQWAQRINLFIRFVGLYVIVQSIISPLNLLQHPNLGDAGALTAATGIGDLFWIYQWILIGLGGLIFTWHLTLKADSRRKRKKSPKTAQQPGEVRV